MEDVKMDKTGFKPALMTVVFALVLSGSSAYAQFKPLQKGEFTDLNLAFNGKQQDVVTCDLNNDGLTDILVTHYGLKDGKFLRYISLYFQYEKNVFNTLPFQTLVLPDSAVALTYGNFTKDDGVEIAFYAEDGVYCYYSVGGLYWETPDLLVFTPTFFQKPQKNSIPFFMGRNDIDDNGLDDLVVPQKDNILIFLQTSPGAYSDIYDLECPPDNTVTRGDDARRTELFQYQTSMPVVFVADVNGDRKKDIILLRLKKYYCHLRNAKTGFSPEPDISCELPVVSEKIVGNKLDTAFVKFVEINGDSCIDLVITNTEGDLSSLGDINTKQYIFLNNKNGTFPATPSQIIKVDGISINPQITDIDRDGYMDLALSSFSIDIVRGAILGDVAITYYVYHFLPGKNRFGDIPDFDRTVYVPTSRIEKSGGKSMTNIHFTGDFNGDRKNDMLIYSAAQKENFEIRINSDSKGSIRFEKDSYFLNTLKEQDLPKEIRILDFNGDGKSDILMLYGGSRLTVKISRRIV